MGGRDQDLLIRLAMGVTPDLRWSELREVAKSKESALDFHLSLRWSWD